VTRRYRGMTRRTPGTSTRWSPQTRRRRLLRHRRGWSGDAGANRIYWLTTVRPNGPPSAFTCCPDTRALRIGVRPPSTAGPAMHHSMSSNLRKRGLPTRLRRRAHRLTVPGSSPSRPGPLEVDSRSLRRSVMQRKGPSRAVSTSPGPSVSETSFWSRPGLRASRC
jgi:hypothetical protein